MKRIFISFLVIIIFWEVVRVACIDGFQIEAFFFPSSLDIIEETINNTVKLDFWEPVIITTTNIIFSLVIVTFLSFILGSCLGYLSTGIYTSIRPAWDFLRSTPPATLFPIFLVIFGLGIETKIWHCVRIAA